MAGAFVVYCDGVPGEPCGVPTLLVRRGGVLTVGRARITDIDRHGRATAVCPNGHPVVWQREGTKIG